MRELHDDTFLLELIAETGASLDEARWLAAATVPILGSMIDDVAIDHISRSAPLLAQLLAAGDEVPANLEDLVRRVQGRAALSPAQALEGCGVIARLLAEALPGGDFVFAPPDVVTLFSTERAPSIVVAHRGDGERGRPGGMRLSTGRPGSSHPIATARSGVGVAHSGSVVAGNPHGDSKLSSGAFSVERYGQTLSSGTTHRSPTS